MQNIPKLTFILDRAAFFNCLRANKRPFGSRLNQKQVEGCERIINEGLRRKTPLQYLAYILATTAWETAQTMQPVVERGRPSYFKKYEPDTRIGKVLGNTLSGDGARFKGRGYVQITGRRNYHLASGKTGHDLVANPDLALDPDIALTTLFVGMEEGWFTSKDLDDFIDPAESDDDLHEYVCARKIINGTDKATTIGRIAEAFEEALEAASYPREWINIEPAALPVPKPKVPPLVQAAVGVSALVAVGYKLLFGG